MRGAGSEDPGARGRGPALANIAEEAEENRRVTITEASATEMAHIEEHVGRITQAIN
jgi:tetrahydromethanopterin S-methyltransferase subunit A